MNVDHFFNIGTSHKVCQDYALSGNTDHIYYGIISDGCSSSKDTDFGSRFLCKSAESILNDKIDIVESDIKTIWSNAMKYINIDPINIKQECLDATLLMILGNEEKINVLVTGDGYIVAKKNTGEVELITIRYKGNAPVYVNYWYDPIRFNKLIITFDCSKTVIIDNVSTQSTNLYEKFSFSVKDYQFVSILTDGLQSFQKNVESLTTLTKEQIPESKVINECGLIDYKNWNGQFVERRMIKCMKELDKNGITHYDDLAISTICTK